MTSVYERAHEAEHKWLRVVVEANRVGVRLVKLKIPEIDYALMSGALFRGSNWPQEKFLGVPIEIVDAR